MLHIALRCTLIQQNDPKRKFQLQIQHTAQLCDHLLLAFPSKKEQSQKLISKLCLQVLFLCHLKLGKALCHIDTKQIGNALHLFFASEDPDYTDDLIIQEDRHIVAFLGSRITWQILFFDPDRLSGCQNLRSPLMEITDPVLFRRRNDDALLIHDVNGPLANQQRGSFYKILCQLCEFTHCVFSFYR